MRARPRAVPRLEQGGDKPREADVMSDAELRKLVQGAAPIFVEAAESAMTSANASRTRSGSLRTEVFSVGTACR